MGISALPVADPGGPLARYQQLLAAGIIAADTAQACAIQRLQKLWTELRDYKPRSGRFDAFSRLVSFKGSRSGRSPPLGLYLVGGVGRGKSMLMDLFFEVSTIERRKRVHFHAFMQDIRDRMLTWHSDNPSGGDPIPSLAKSVADEASLLCFDEFQIHDIADAMVLGRLFEALFQNDVVIVATSNTKPDDLYAGQPGRDALIPFINLINAKLGLVVLDGCQDWRRFRLGVRGAWLVPADQHSSKMLDSVFDREAPGQTPSLTSLKVLGRELAIPLACEKAARFGFHDLCGRALGPSDYLAIASRFEVVVVDGIPKMDHSQFDVARRFVTFIDACYEHRVKLTASAAAVPDRLYERGRGADMFKRTASRLLEMQTAEYLALPHIA